MALIECSECGKSVSDKASACPNCGAPINMVEAQPVTLEATQKSTMQMSTQVILGLAGSCLMAFGVFLPFAQAPIVGAMNLFKNGSGDGYYIMLLALLTALLFLIKKWIPAIITSTLAAGILLIDVINFNTRLGQIQADMRRELADNPFRDMATGMMESVSMDIGAFVVGLGALLSIGAAIWAVSQAKAEN